MKTILSSETMDIPDDVKIFVKVKLIEAEGPRGKLCRDFKHLNLDFQLIKDESGKRKLNVEARQDQCRDPYCPQSRSESDHRCHQGISYEDEVRVHPLSNQCLHH